MSEVLADRTTLRLSDVRVALAGRELVRLDAAVPAGDVLVLMGPSGSGKSSLLAYIAGFLDPVFDASGTVAIGGVDVTRLLPAQRQVGVLFQDPLLFPHMSVGGNLVFAVPRGERRRREVAEAALRDAGLDGFYARDPATLSGGQAARVALMRVLVSRPRALLLDEPFSKLDADRRERVRRFTFATARERRLPVLLVTHDEEDAAAALADGRGEVVRL